MKGRCQGNEKCKVRADRNTFGFEECPDADEAAMTLWVTFSCDGSGEDQTIIRKPICYPPPTQPPQTHPPQTHPPPTHPPPTHPPPTHPRPQPTKYHGGGGGLFGGKLGGLLGLGLGALKGAVGLGLGALKGAIRGHKGRGHRLKGRHRGHRRGFGGPKGYRRWG